MTFRLSLILGISMGVCLGLFFATTEIDKGIMDTLYSISGIMFSISMSLIVTFNTSDIFNKRIRNSIITALKRLRTKHILFFLVVSLCYLSSIFLQKQQLKHIGNIEINPNYLTITFMILSIIYYIISFISIQRFREDLDNQIRKEKTRY